MIFWGWIFRTIARSTKPYASWALKPAEIWRGVARTRKKCLIIIKKSRRGGKSLPIALTALLSALTGTRFIKNWALLVRLPEARSLLSSRQKRRQQKLRILSY